MSREPTSKFAHYSAILQGMSTKTVFGEETCSESTVKKWSLRFRGGRESIEDDPRIGQPVTATTANNIALVAEMCDSDLHITVEQLAGTLDLSTGSVHTILTKHLGMSKICSRWVPHFLTQAQKKNRLRMAKNLLEKYEHCDERRLSEICTGDETWIRYSEPPRKQQNKVWVAKGSAPPGLSRPDRWAPKVMYTIFFDAYGPVCQICAPKGQTITGNFYATIVLPEIQKHYFKRRPATRLKGIKLLHDNARPHKSKQVKETIASMGLEELEHPPYSPDLAPCDFWLFDGLKRHLAGSVFEEDAQIERAIRLYLRDIPQEEYKKTFFKWIERLKLVIEQKGDYFEHLM